MDRKNGKKAFVYRIVMIEGCPQQSPRFVYLSTV